MRAQDALRLPVLAVLNIQPLPRRQGLMVLRAEVEQALHEVGLDRIALPEGRLLDAVSVEKLLQSSANPSAYASRDGR